MPKAPHNEYVSFDDYLAGERDVNVRNEYVDGQVYAMAGASETHNTISTSLTAAIDNGLPDSCRVWQSDMKEKFDNYKSIASLLEYVVVSQDVPLIRVFRRRAAWNMESYYAEDTLQLESVGLTIAVSHVYRRVRKEVGLEVRL